jgi:hypothetical protein
MGSAVKKSLAPSLLLATIVWFAIFDVNPNKLNGIIVNNSIESKIVVFFICYIIVFFAILYLSNKHEKNRKK